MSSQASREEYELPLIDSQSTSGDANRLKQGGLKHGRLHKWLSGSRFALVLASAACIIVLSFNLGFLLWVVDRNRLKDDRGILYEGDCDRVRHLSTGLHLLINILSTTLLGASNYGMQYLCAPTRKDIDDAHERNSWLDIGVPSLRNLFYIPKRRRTMWLCLVLSSLPLHLVYNSTIFPTTAAYSYTIFAGHSSLGTQPREDLETGDLSEEDTASFDWLYSCAQNRTLTHLDSHACIDAYATTYQTKHGDLLLVTEDVKTNLTYERVGFQAVYDPWETHIRQDPPTGDPYKWLCPPNADAYCSAYLSDMYTSAEQGNWVVYGTNGNYTVDSCLSAPLPEHCKLQYSLPLTIVVIVVNAIKAIILCYMAIATSETPMLTTGDAVASFLQLPDKKSLGKCLMPGMEIQEIPSTSIVPKKRYCPMAYDSTRKRWYSAVSRGKWTLVGFLWVIAFVICAGLLGFGLSEDGHEVWNAEFGSVNAQALIKGDSWPTSMISNTIIANIPQLIFSTLYFIFNGVITTMTLAAEWSTYAISRRGVRVSWNPQYAQRSSYFLSLPYRYAIPLMGTSAILHWLISQSLFLVGIEAYGERFVRDPDHDLVTCGYTPVAIVSAMAVWVFMFACLVGVSWMKFASGMQIAGSCSLAIAAACHPKYDPNLDEKDQQLDPPEGIEFMPLKWGSVPLEGLMGHCTFSADEVAMPESQRVYQ
ncbi:hypothetical protein BDW71DRAFT_195051 [Aspergillus fruticulosus]